ncbi:MAG: sigma-70 family RNA polymerase sigma factor [Cyclobacteriaceae bacterium]|nr:sigma-70 family RNA polymerase sigma factor [Cyclobacteriaceae bacterium HetDA_MAG_MS6]
MGFANQHVTLDISRDKQDVVYNSFSESDLWKRFCSGDGHAFALIYKRYVRSLYNFGFQLSKDTELSKDIIQDIFIKLRFSKSRKPIKSIKSYLFRCFYTEWISRSKSSLAFSSLLDSFAISLSFEDKLVEKQLEQDRLTFLKAALKRLTPKQRKGIMLYFYESMSYEEVAEAMGLKSAKYARKLIYRALDTLRPSETTMKVLYTFFL